MYNPHKCKPILRVECLVLIILSKAKPETIKLYIPLPPIKRIVFYFVEDETVQFQKLIILKVNPLKINILN
jgi:hypothetical protein